MAKPFSTLPGTMKRTATRLATGFDRIVQDAAIAAGAAAVDNTRVDTGAARSNWQASIGVETFSVIPPYAPGNKLGQGESANASAAKSQHRSVIKTFNTRISNSIFFSNNVDHIGILNDGGPFVAPGNMAALGVQAAIASVRGARLLGRGRRRR